MVCAQVQAIEHLIARLSSRLTFVCLVAVGELTNFSISSEHLFSRVYRIMAFLSSPSALFLRAPAHRPMVCGVRMCAKSSEGKEEGDEQKSNSKAQTRKVSVSNSPQSKRKLVRNKAGMEGSAVKSDVDVDVDSEMFADGTAGDMTGGPQVGEGLGPRRGKGEKKVTRAAAIQKGKGFADAWAEQNAGKIDVWIIIGLVTLLTPLVILAWAVTTGVIPTSGLFDE